MSDETTLLSCPFCRGEAVLKEYKPNVSGVAICKECGARSPICKNDHTGGWKPKAIAAWNTRKDEWEDKPFDFSKLANRLNGDEDAYEKERAELGSETCDSERDYWREQFMRCLAHAIKQKEGKVLDNLMSWPRPDNVIEPYQLVTDEIDNLRDYYAELSVKLGSVTLTAEQVREAIENHGTASLGCRFQFTDKNLQAIADELNAPLGSEHHAYEQRITGDGSDWGEIMRNAYDDLMATACESCTPEQMEQLSDYIRAELGSGTCELTLDGTDGCFGCSECLENIPPLANFCPNCGARIRKAAER
jgi:hypothetical protein